jgi:hypothetical protein
MRHVRLVRRSVLLAVVVAVVGFVGVGTASADYGNTAIRQVEISANITGNQGGGAWLWIELSGSTSGGTGTYTGSDCGRGAAQHAVADSGDNLTWTSDGTTITISGVVLNGFGGLPVTVTVPWKTGHYPGTIQDVFPTLALLPPGFSQTTVAP